MAMRLTDFASPIRPRRSMTRAGFRPSRWCGNGSASTSSSATGSTVVAAWHNPFALGAAVGRDDAALGVAGFEYTQHTRRALGQAIDRAALILVGAGGPQPSEDPVPGRETCLPWAFRDHADQRRAAVGGVPDLGPSNRIAV